MLLSSCHKNCKWCLSDPTEPQHLLRTCISLTMTVLVWMSSWSASVDLPWSMWAMIEKFRI